jgi:peptide/nickel transport system permease protein/oligopeptide transport system permease protein
MRLADITLAFPTLLLLIAVAAIPPSLFVTFVVIGLVGWLPWRGWSGARRSCFGR